jgi:hypothetical protein
MMVDNTNLKKEMITMQKFTFTVDIVSDSGLDTESVNASLLATVAGVGTMEAVHPAKVSPLAEQGYKVWAKRVAGVSLATPKVKKTKPVAAAVETETVGA